MGVIPVLNGVRVEELAGIVCGISCFLKPDWEPIVVESLSYELRVSAYVKMNTLLS